MRLGPPLVTLLLLAGALLGCAEDEQPEEPGSSTETTSETPTATPGEPDDASLVRAENNPEFFPETGYLNGGLATRNGNAWESGTSAPDAVFGPSELQPEAFFDLETGTKGIEAWWVERLAGNTRGLLSPDQTPTRPTTFKLLERIVDEDA